MDKHPLVSVCIPTYNGARFVEETINSVVTQTYSNIEILVSDHDSTDSTCSIIESFTDNRIRLSILSSKGNAATNWNACAKNAQGKYIKLLCQDDLLTPKCIELQVERLEGHPTASFCFSPRDIISPKSRTLIRSRGYKPGKETISLESGIGELVRSGTNFFGEPCAVLMNRETLLKAGDFKGSYLIDLDMWLRLWTLGDAVFLNESLSKFRISRGSWTTALAKEQSSQIAHFFQEVQNVLPTLISHEDLKVGITNSRKLEKKRQLLTKIVELLGI